jgi:hypothetical protein
MDNLTERPPLDQHALGYLLKSINDRSERDGWSDDGSGFMVYVLYEVHDVVTANRLEDVMRCMGSPVRADRYAAQPLLAPRMFDAERGLATGLESPSDQLYNFAMNMGFADADIVRQHTGRDGLNGVRAILRQPGVLGFAACAEAWGMKALTPVVKALIDSGVPMNDIKGCQETRLVLAADIAGRLHRVVRWRDDDEIITHHGVHLCNKVAISLRILSRFASGEPMPTSSDEFRKAFHSDCGRPHED